MTEALERDTIIALSTAAGRAGIAVLRLSGPQTRFAVETIAGRVGEPRMAGLTQLRDPATGERLDEALVIFFPGPNSFTGEDLAEFHVHGSRAVISSVMHVIVSLSPDIRHAKPGEFSRRAFENGKMDLAAVEGLADLIDSETEWQRKQALRLMNGALGKKVLEWREHLLTSLAYLDAEIDFSDEGDVGTGWIGSAMAGAALAAQDIKMVLSLAGTGERIREGFDVVIIGPPNVGKSSLLNAFAQRDVAIVTDSPGTTRDLIDLRCDLDGLPVTLTDTAGLRDSLDQVELEGMRRARQRAASADLVLRLHTIDSPPEHSSVDTEISCIMTLNVATKIDLGRPPGPCDFAVSTVTGEGIISLMQGIVAVLKQKVGEEPALVSQARQSKALEQAHIYLMKSVSLTEQFEVPAELIAENMRLAIFSLEELIGRVNVDDVLDRIFLRFCIGK